MARGKPYTAFKFIKTLVFLLFLRFNHIYGDNKPLTLANNQRIIPPFPRQFNNRDASEHNRDIASSSSFTNEVQETKNNGYEYDIGYYEQNLDHFSFRRESYNTFRQRYLISTKFWTGTGPILFYCGNEGDIEWFAVNTGFMWDLAPQLGAMLLFAEHRYYGKSIPDIALNNHTIDTLGFLTSEQALADFASLITDLKNNYSAQASPVIAFGGSYGGMLAAWFRLKYPHIVIGALASSAPILQFDNIVSDDSFYRIASNDFKRESSSCFETIRDSWNALENLSKDPRRVEAIMKEFGFCRNASKTTDTLVKFVEIAWVYLPMVDYPYPANFLMPLPANPIKVVCTEIDGKPNGTDIISRVLAGAQVYWNGTGNAQCFDPNEDPHGMNLWGWQACTEIVMPLTSNPKNSMFPPWTFNLDERRAYCQSTYGVNPRPKWIPQEFGGQNITLYLKHFGSNIIFSNGLLDPWSGGGVLKNISDTLVAIVTQLGAHHLDLRAATKFDPQWLVAQRNEEIFHIKNWIKQYYYDSKCTD